jgi:hypothetical protein
MQGGLSSATPGISLVLRTRLYHGPTILAAKSLSSRGFACDSQYPRISHSASIKANVTRASFSCSFKGRSWYKSLRLFSTSDKNAHAEEGPSRGKRISGDKKTRTALVTGRAHSLVQEEGGVIRWPKRCVFSTTPGKLIPGRYTDAAINFRLLS